MGFLVPNAKVASDCFPFHCLGSRIKGTQWHRLFSLLPHKPGDNTKSWKTQRRMAICRSAPGDRPGGSHSLMCLDPLWVELEGSVQQSQQLHQSFQTLGWLAPLPGKNECGAGRSYTYSSRYVYQKQSQELDVVMHASMFSLGMLRQENCSKFKLRSVGATL